MRRVQNTEDALNDDDDDDDNDEMTMMMTMMPTMRMLEVVAITMIIEHYREYFLILFQNRRGFHGMGCQLTLFYVR